MNVINRMNHRCPVLKHGSLYHPAKRLSRASFTFCQRNTGDIVIKDSVHTWKPASVISNETSSGGLTTPATDFTRDIKRSGNQTMQISSTTIMPPIPYFTTFFFFWPRG